MQERAQVICLTPTKNEEWIIERFVNAAALWADRIIIADQMSTDQTVEFAKKCNKVSVIQNPSERFNENERQKLLIREARKLTGKKLLVTLDADEFLTANFHESSEWKQMLYAEEGTVFNMKWPFIKDDFQHYWEAEEPYNKFAVMDDGSPHTGLAMHSIRIPMRDNATEVFLKDIKVMHFQYTDWKRMESKHLWYQCFERVEYPRKGVCEIYRTYHHMYIRKAYRQVPDDWFQYYLNQEVELKQNSSPNNYWWDEEVEQYIHKYGEGYFKYIDIKTNNNLVLLYLRYTQGWFRDRYKKAVLRRFDSCIDLLLKNDH